MKLFSKITIFLFFIIISIGCIRFRVENYKPELITKIKIGEGVQYIEGITINNVITNLPFTFPIYSRRIFVSDFKNSMIKIFDFNGQFDYSIGGTGANLKIPGKTKNIFHKFGVIGLIAPSEKDEIYVQNRITSKDQITKKNTKDTPYTKFSGSLDIEEDGNIPSYIFKITSKGATDIMIGVSGINTEPFRYIEKMYAFDDDHLFVYYKYAEEMRLSHYINGALNSTIKESNLDAFSGEEAKKYKTKLENIIPHIEDGYALAAISYFTKNDNRFKFRRIYKCFLKKEKADILLHEVQDPSEVLFSLKKNGEFYIWETEDGGNSVKLQVHDKEGNHINNIRLTYTAPRGQWRETYTDPDDNIYSIRIRSGFVEIYKWK